MQVSSLFYCCGAKDAGTAKFCREVFRRACLGIKVSCSVETGRLCAAVLNSECGRLSSPQGFHCDFFVAEGGLFFPCVYFFG